MQYNMYQGNKRCQIKLRAGRQTRSKIPPNLSFHRQISETQCVCAKVVMVCINAVFTESFITLLRFEQSQWVNKRVFSRISIFEI